MKENESKQTTQEQKPTIKEGVLQMFDDAQRINATYLINGFDAVVDEFVGVAIIVVSNNDDGVGCEAVVVNPYDIERKKEYLSNKLDDGGCYHGTNKQVCVVRVIVSPMTNIGYKIDNAIEEVYNELGTVRLMI